MTLTQIREWYSANKNRIVPDEQAMMIQMIGDLLAIADAARDVVENARFSSVSYYIGELERRMSKRGGDL